MTGASTLAAAKMTAERPTRAPGKTAQADPLCVRCDQVARQAGLGGPSPRDLLVIFEKREPMVLNKNSVVTVPDRSWDEGTEAFGAVFRLRERPLARG